MPKQKFLPAALALVVVMPVMTVAQTAALTTAFFEKNHVSPRNAAALHATISDKTLSIKKLNSGAIERVYYGARRIDAKGEKTRYKISQAGIEEQYDGAPRVLLIYDWRGHAYVCLENLGELDMLGGAEGTCPYEIVATTEGNKIK
jgi:hypothetical protein